MVAEELAYMFAAIGYPLVFQTDNGSEFTADVVLKMVRNWNASCKTVTGRRRTPRDQGSVERTNATIKTVIAKLEQKERNRGNREPNWVELAPAAMSAVNCSITNGHAQQSAYSHVFGMEYTIPLMAPPSQLRKARTVEDLDRLINSPEFRNKMIAIGELEAGDVGNNDDITDDKSRNSDDVPDALDTVSKELFPDVGTPTPNVCQDVVVLNGVTHLDSDSVRHVADPGDSSPDAAAAESSPMLVDPPPTKESLMESNSTPGDIKTALKEPTGLTVTVNGTDFRLVIGRLLCELCNDASPPPLVTVAEDAYYTLNRDSNEWWQSDMVSTFGILVAHDVHRTDMIYADCGTPTRAEYLKETAAAPLAPSVLSIVSIAHSNGHFAVLRLDIQEEVMIVYDALGFDVENWNRHMLYLVARFGLPRGNWRSQAANYRKDLDGLVVVQRDGHSCGPIACVTLWKLFKPYTMELAEIDVGQYRNVVTKEFTRLLALYSDHIVVCSKKRRKKVQNLALKSPPRNPIDDPPVEGNVEVPPVRNWALKSPPRNPSDDSPVEGKEAVPPVATLEDIMSKEDIVEKDKQEISHHERHGLVMGDGLYDTGPCDGLSSDSDVESTANVNTTEAKRVQAVESHKKRVQSRELSDRKRRLVQDKQATKMRGRYRKKTRLELGETVVVKVDERDRANHNPLGIPGIVAARVGSANNVKIVTMAGVLSARNKHVTYAPEELGILEDATLPSKLQAIKESVMKGTFDITSHPLTSVANAHKLLYGSETSGRGRCACKSKCGAKCGCRRKKIPCSSSCLCGAKCGNL